MKYRLIDPDEREIRENHHLSKLAAKVIAAGSITESQLKELLDPGALTTSRADCVKKACERIIQAKKRGEKVFVGGDYDADGICATAIMKKTLDLLGIENGFYIPDRLKEGYGLSAATVQLAYDKGYTLVITVDNGVKCAQAIQRAHACGIDIIITDHHVIEGEIDTDIVVHPDYMEDEYSTLCGAGVALQISRALIGDQMELTALAAVASIGDVMPLWKETRRIVTKGMEIMRHGMPKALCSLFQANTAIDETAIAFQVVPKLNCAARLSHLANVNTVVLFLLSDNPSTIESYCRQLNELNDTRKKLSSAMVSKAETMIDDSAFLVLYDSSFAPGIAGLTAGKIANEYHRPTLVFAPRENCLVGSARGVDGFNVYDFFSDFEGLQEFGGHAMAAGLTIPKETYGDFCRAVEKKMQSIDFTYQEPVKDVILIDEEDMNIDEIMGLYMLSPFPKDMQEPLFAIQNPQVKDAFKRQKFARYALANSSGGYEAVQFQELDAFTKTPSVLIGKCTLKRMRDKMCVQMMIEHIEK